MRREYVLQPDEPERVGAKLTHRTWCQHLRRLNQLSYSHRACTETSRCVAGEVSPVGTEWEQTWRSARGRMTG